MTKASGDDADITDTADQIPDVHDGLIGKHATDGDGEMLRRMGMQHTVHGDHGAHGVTSDGDYNGANSVTAQSVTVTEKDDEIQNRRRLTLSVCLRVQSVTELLVQRR